MPTTTGSDSQGMILTQDPIWPVYTPQPINPDHGLNAGRVLWLLAVPPLDGGSKWWDLCAVCPGTLTSMTTLASNGWRVPTRSNGFPCLQFDGTASSVTTGFLGLSSQTQYSIAMWFKRPTVSTIAALVGATTGAANNVMITAFSDGNVYFSPGNSSTQSFNFASNDTNWHRLVIVFDGTQSTNATRGKAYLDGVAQSPSYFGTFPASSPTIASGLVVGHDVNLTRWANGQQDDIAVWNRPLTPADVWADFELSRLGYPGVLNRWRPTPSMFAAGGNAFTFSCSAGSYALSGQAATLTTQRHLVTAAGTYVLSGQAATLTTQRHLVTAAGTYALSGQAATLASQRHLSAGAGAYSLTGHAATFTASHVLVASAGSYALSGQPATFVDSAGGPPLVIYVDPRAVQLVAGASDSDLLGVDPRAVQLVSNGNDADPFGVDPRSAQLVS